MIEFFASGLPKGQGRPRAFAVNMGGKWTARAYNPTTAEGFKGSIAVSGRPFVPPVPFGGPVRVDAAFVFPRPKSHYRTGKNAGVLRPDAPHWHTSKPDRDNLDKAVLDTLKTLGFLKDDAVACLGELSKVYGDAPGCKIWISTLENRVMP